MLLYVLYDDISNQPRDDKKSAMAAVLQWKVFTVGPTLRELKLFPDNVDCFTWDRLLLPLCPAVASVWFGA